MNRILVVDDNVSHLESLGVLLESSGYEVIKESEAEKVLKIAQEQKPDLIMMDFRMPGMSGFEVVKLLKSNAATKDIVILIFSATVRSGEMFKEALEVGAEDFISMPADNKEIISRVKVCLDRKKYINELKETEGALRLAYSNLKETQSQLIQAEKLNVAGRLASGVAHEVRNPLAAALQAVNYLEKSTPHPKTDILQTLALLKRNIKRADKIISLLLDFSKVASLNLQSEDINSILGKSLDLVKYRVKLERIEIIKEIKEELPKVLVDKNRMEQVFVNILLNAIQAMPKGGKLTIRIYDKQLEAIRKGIGRRADDHFRVGERVVVVEVEDTGIGISEEDLKRIFDPFFTTKGPTGGVGLGLSITHSIIDMHRGLIDVKSEIGKGTKVILTLKIVEGHKNR